MIQTLYDTGSDHLITSKMDGAVYDIACGGDCVCGGVGDEFALNYMANSLTVTFKTGSQAIIGGGFFKITEDESITLPSNATVYLCLRIDTSKPNGKTGSIVALTSAQIKKENINGGGAIRDLLLYTINTTASGISTVADKKITRTFNSVSNYIIWVGTQTEYDAIEIKDESTIYHILEE